MNEWVLRDELFKTTHRWPLIVLYCLVGCLLGGAAGLIWPSPYQASTELYVGLDVYRSNQDRNVSAFAEGFQFNYADDYKNWQMANLNTLVIMEDVLQEALSQLRLQDPYWNNITTEDLSGMLQVYWRNAGRWRMTAQDPNRDFAAQAVQAWRDVVLQKVHQAVQHARDTQLLDIRLQEIAGQQAEVMGQIARLESGREGLQRWRETASGWPGEVAVESTDSFSILSWAAQTLAYHPVWATLQEGFPEDGTPATAYTAWLDKVSIALDDEGKLLQDELAGLEQDRADLEAQYTVAAQGSRGFSANLDVSPVSEAPPDVTLPRPVALLALIGGILGFLAWAGAWLGRLALEARR